MPVRTSSYYATYHGHDVEHLEELLPVLRRGGNDGKRACIFLAGDSSLDNKFWFENSADALNGYEHVLEPPRMKLDICYWLNFEARRRGLSELFCLNTAIEATTLNDRSFGCVLAQDRFIRDHIGANDYLVVSVGGNDLAMAPVLATIINIIPLLCCTPQWCVEHCSVACPPNLHVDCGCFGCGLPGCVAGTLCGWPPGMGYFVDLFANRVQNYIVNMLGSRRPRKVVACMIYFLDVAGRGSWADGFLCCMGYNCAPSRLQSAIRAVFNLATRRIRIPGTEVVAMPLFEVLDGSCSEDYVQRVEPSPTGGRKIATALIDAILDGEDDGSEAMLLRPPGGASMQR